MGDSTSAGHKRQVVGGCTDRSSEGKDPAPPTPEAFPRLPWLFPSENGSEREAGGLPGSEGRRWQAADRGAHASFPGSCTSPSLVEKQLPASPRRHFFHLLTHSTIIHSFAHPCIKQVPRVSSSRHCGQVHPADSTKAHTTEQSPPLLPCPLSSSLAARPAAEALGPPRAESWWNCRSPSEGDQLNSPAQDRDRAQTLHRTCYSDPTGRRLGQVRRWCGGPPPLCQMIRQLIRSLTSEALLGCTLGGAEDP